MLIKQMQYSPLQTEKDRVSEWGSFRYAVFCCMEMLLYLSSPYKYGKMYKSPCKKKAGMGDEMTFRTSDILIRGSLIIIGLTEIAHLAGCLLGWSFLTVTDLLLAEVGIVLLAAILLSVISRQTRKRATAGKNDPVADQNSGTDTAKEKSTQILTGILAFLILLQILRILTGNRMWLTGDMTVETVNTFLRENAVYTVNPLTGTAYSMGMSLRLKILCLPTLYGAISRFTGMAPVDVVYRLIPCITLLLSYVAYGSLGKVLFPENSVKRRTFLLIMGILFSTGAYMPGVDGFDVFYGGFRGVTIRAAVLLPYLLFCLMDRKYTGVILCILAEACIVWTLYGAGVCLLVTVAWLILGALVSQFRKRWEKRKMTDAHERRLQNDDTSAVRPDRLDRLYTTWKICGTFAAGDPVSGICPLWFRKGSQCIRGGKSTETAVSLRSAGDIWLYLSRNGTDPVKIPDRLLLLCMDLGGGTPDSIDRMGSNGLSV